MCVLGDGALEGGGSVWEGKWAFFNHPHADLTHGRLRPETLIMLQNMPDCGTHLCRKFSLQRYNALSSVHPQNLKQDWTKCTKLQLNTRQNDQLYPNDCHRSLDLIVQEHNRPSTNYSLGFTGTEPERVIIASLVWLHSGSHIPSHPHVKLWITFFIRAYKNTNLIFG